MKKYQNMSVESILASQKRAAVLRTAGYAAAVLVVVFSLLAYWYGVISMISALTFIIAGILFFRLVARMHKLRYGKVELILLDDCDCDKYIRIYEAVREKKPEKSRLDTISIAKGYFFKGDFKRAKQELESIDRESLKGSTWIPYYNVALQNYLELGEMQHAKEARQEIEKHAANQKSGSPAAKLAEQLIQYADFAESFRRRDYETARKLQENIRKLSSHASQLSLLYYRMAVMELEAGSLGDAGSQGDGGSLEEAGSQEAASQEAASSLEAAREHLEYVKEYGGQIFVRKEAEKLLEEHWGSI